MMTLSPILSLILAPVCLVVWLMTAISFSRRTSLVGRFAEGALRLGVGTLALYLAMDCLGKWFTLSTPWPVAALAAAGSAAVEWVRFFSRLERLAVPPKTARLLLGLRVALVLALLLMLLQPVRIWENRRTIRREVAVLFDGSASMQVPDSGMSPGEKLRLAEQLGVPGAIRKVRLERPAADLEQVRQELGSVADVLSAAQAAGPETARQAVKDDALRRRLTQAGKRAREALDVLVSPAAAACFPASSPVRGRLSGLTAAVKRDSLDPVAALVPVFDMAATNDKPDAAVAACRDGQDKLRRAAVALADTAPQLGEVANLADDALAQAITGSVMKAIEAAAGARRCDLAVTLWNSRLLKKDGSPGGDSLAVSLDNAYGTRPFLFDGAVSPVDRTSLSTNSAGLFAAGAEKGTDLAAALDGIARAFPPSGLAGVVMFTDGRHHAPSSVDDAVKAFQSKNIPVIPVAMGGWRRPPLDAGLMSIDAPESVRTNDRVTVTAMLKADGLRGTNLAIRLYRNALCVGTQVVNAATDSFRQRIALADEPRSNGLYRYRLEVDAFPSEVTLSNNTASVPVMVTDSQIRLLVVESRPRWEFRYLKNLFSGRDRSVRLQHVLLEPDTIAGLPPQAPIPASASRGVDEVEATVLPQSPEEWLKFDVIVIGDVAPSAFTNNEPAVWDRFVKERGGLLIVIAGPRSMPRAWRDTPLAGLLPVTVGEAPIPWLASPDEAYRVRLTAEGRGHPLVKLAPDAAESEATWNRLPSLYWRHPIQSVKAGASVLLYAVSESALAAAAPEKRADTLPDEESLKRLKEMENSHALLTLQSIGLGRVVFFAFDQTWRLRYWVGDTWHHTLWGQVVRDGGGDKLVAGDSLARVGASKLRYLPGTPVIVRARLLKADYAPRTDADALVEIWQGAQLVTRGAMQPVAGRSGFYERRFDALPEGDYRVVLSEKEIPAPVETGFSVVSEMGSEMSELGADRGLLGRLADQTGGRVIEAWRLEDVAGRLKAPSETLTERRQWDLWDSWWLLGLVLALGAAEWLVRKRAGLI
jgi:hypothetical protein